MTAGCLSLLRLFLASSRPEPPTRRLPPKEDGSNSDGSSQLSRLERVLRRARPADADALAAVLTVARRAGLYPAAPHPEDDHPFVTQRMLPANEVWVVAEAGEVVGFASLGHDLLGHLDVAPRAQGRGIGRVLLDKVKQRRPEGFTL